MTSNFGINSATLKKWRFGIIGFSTAVCVAISTTILLELLVRLFDPLDQWSGWYLALIFVVTAILSVYLGLKTYETARQAIRTRNRLRTQRNTLPIKCLIMTISPLNAKNQDWAERAIGYMDRQAGKDPVERRKLIKAICDGAPLGDLEPLDFWPWQQSLRLLLKYHRSLQRVHYVLSPQSVKQIEEFNKFADCLLREPKKMITMTPLVPSDDAGPDSKLTGFEDFDAAEDVISGVIDREAQQWSGNQDIAVDITAGQKVWSVLAMLATINRPAIAAYVDTNTNEIRLYGRETDR